MNYDQFADLADRLWDQIPARFKQGLHAMHVLEQRKTNPEEPGLVILGTYLDQGTPSVFGGNVGIGRHIALYYGSFVQIARHDAQFNWQGEIWETLVHELQHHLESLSGWNGLVLDDLEQLRKFKHSSQT